MELFKDYGEWEWDLDCDSLFCGIPNKVRLYAISRFYNIHTFPYFECNGVLIATNSMLPLLGWGCQLELREEQLFTLRNSIEGSGNSVSDSSFIRENLIIITTLKQLKATREQVIQERFYLRRNGPHHTPSGTEDNRFCPIP